MEEPVKPVERWFAQAELAARYHITVRALQRWVKTERFPKPDYFLPGGQPRWSDTLVTDHERSIVGKPAA